MTNFYSKLNISALDAISAAQELVHGPVIFQAVYSLLSHGILEEIDKHPEGVSVAELVKSSDLNEYALGLLLDVGCSAKVILVSDEGLYTLSKVGYFILNDTMTRTNFEFYKQVCYQSMDHLDEALVTGKPAGLAVFNPEWKTIYPYLSSLPPKARDAWFAWDHLYSQTAFKESVLKIQERYNPQLIYDVGGNSGNFAVLCAGLLPQVRIRILDLKEQIALAQENIKASRLEDRIDFQPVDMLQDPDLPADADIWWMSQFLDCFAPEDIIKMLSSISRIIKKDACLCILEPLADRQKFPAASLAINAGSLYFTAIANGYSRFFSTPVLTGILEKSGFVIEEVIDNLGLSNSLFICRKA